MADEKALEVIKSGVKAWNIWRKSGHGEAQAMLARRWHFKPPSASAFPDLQHADLEGLDLMDCDLTDCNLQGAILRHANLTTAAMQRANLSHANLDGAILEFADLTHASLVRASLVGANLHTAFLPHADLSSANLATATLTETHLESATMRGSSLYATNLIQANLQFADLHGSDLQSAIMVDTIVEGAKLSDCSVYGLSVWRIQGVPAEQSDLIVTPNDEPKLTVDRLDLAQFVYLLLNNPKIRDVIDTMGKKGVLILGRFSEERKAVLDGIRQKLRELNFVPMMFDFEKPTQRDYTETIKTLAGMSRFIIADITNPRSIPLELQAIMPDYMIPFVPIIQEDEEPFAMFQDLKHKYGKWVLDVLKYDSVDSLLQVLENAVVKPALVMAQELLTEKAEAIRTRHVKDYM